MERKQFLLNGRPLCVLVCNRFFLRLRGLIGRTLGKGEGLLLTPCSSVHTFLMAYPIDILYLDRRGRVLHCDAAVPPGRMLRPVRGAKQVLELPAGTVEAGQPYCLEEN